MNGQPEWIPPLVLFSDNNGDWNVYVEVLYNYFKTDFVDNKPTFQGRTLGLKRHPMTHGKEATFWHMIQDGTVEEERTPDMRRCERIRWPKPTIENCDSDGLKVWITRKNHEDRIHIFIEALDYVVVLTDRKGYLLPWTAFLVTREHTKRKLLKEYETYQKTLT